MNKKSKRTPSLPSKAEILAFIGNQPGKVGTREIARAFGLKNALRADLKRLLRDMADEGSVEKRRKKLHHPGALPSTVLADVTARDNDGDLIATPDEWDEDAHGPAPKIRISVPRKPRPGEAAGLGDRVLLFSPHPGRIQEEFAVDLPRPRDINSVDLAGYATKIMRALKSFSPERAAAAV